jgi:hypothetical protein
MTGWNDDITPGTVYTQQAGMSGDVDTDNVQDFAESAQTAATNAATSETNAASSASSAATSASNASTSATNAATSATNASNSATSASTSATNAAASETAAAASEAAAASSASSASTSATNAASAQTAAESARDLAEAAYDNFDDRYLGAKTADPTLDNDGNALITGALYFNTTDDVMKVYNGTSWLAIPVSETYTGTVTSVGGTGTVNGLTLTGTVTTSGNLTLEQSQAFLQQCQLALQFLALLLSLAGH